MIDMRWKPFQRAVDDPAFVEAIGKAIDCSESVWRLLEALRVNLAKHQEAASRCAPVTAGSMKAGARSIGRSIWATRKSISSRGSAFPISS
jgi:hypothetical protein